MGDLRYRPCRSPSTPASGRELCDLFDELGPDAPTLCEGWTTFDLAAHLVVRERNPLAGARDPPRRPRSRPAHRAADGARKGQRLPRALVERVRTGPPLGPCAVPGLRTLLNLIEYVVHHEDVRRANGLGPRTDRADLAGRACGACCAARRRLDAAQGRRRRACELERPGGGAVVARPGPARCALTGEPVELLLYLVRPARARPGRAHRRRRRARAALEPALARDLTPEAQLGAPTMPRSRRPVRPSQRTAKSTSVARSSPESR